MFTGIRSSSSICASVLGGKFMPVSILGDDSVCGTTNYKLETSTVFFHSSFIIHHSEFPSNLLPIASEKERRGIFWRTRTSVDMYNPASQDSENVWDWDLITNRIHYSSAWISMLGWGGADFGNTSDEWFSRVHPEDSESVQQGLRAHLAQGATEFEIQHRLLHQDGCYRWTVCRGMISRDSNGQAIRVRGFHIDKTDEKVVDTVTGLPNRIWLLDRLARSIEKAKKRDDFIFAVLVVDLDLFETGTNRLETVNTDSLITAAARRLETSLRSRDVSIREGRAHLIARSGGDEFIVLLEGLTEAGEAKKTAEKLLKEILAPFDFNGKELFLSPSIGIAISATRYRDAEDALRDADTALYRAKSLGKSRCEVFDTAALDAMRNQNQLEQEIQRGLHRNEFVVFCQPIVSLSTNQVAGFESVVRWNHPSRGLVPPMEFIPVAEKSGLIVPLDRQILLQACNQLRIWKEDPRISKDVWISVNLSSSQFLQPSLAKDIQGILQEAGIDAGSLMLELTEGTVMANPEAARDLLMQLRVMGVRVGLDDFGTGYSSLAYLRRFPLDYLKIDHAFIRSIENSADALEITRAIALLSRQLGLRVIAEGIETQRQLEIVRSLGCEYGQGFLFSRAVEPEQAQRFLLEGFAQHEDDSGALPIPDSDDRQKPSQKPGLFPGRKHFFLGLSVVALLILGTILAKLNRQPPPLPTNPRQLAKASVAEDLPKPALLPATPEAVPGESRQTEPPSATGAKSRTKVPGVLTKKAPKAPAAVFSFPVIHDHVLGTCEGILSFTTNGISFVSEKGKDSFDFAPTECNYMLERDRLTIKAGQKTFRFKSATARSKDENLSQVSEIYRSMSRLYEPGPKQPSAKNSK